MVAEITGRKSRDWCRDIILKTESMKNLKIKTCAPGANSFKDKVLYLQRQAVKARPRRNINKIFLLTSAP